MSTLLDLICSGLDYIKEIVSKLLSGKTLVGQEITDILNIGNLIAFKLV